MNEAYPPTALLSVTLLCRCPRCGEGKLYAGLLTVVPTCTVCGLDLAARAAEDGPAAFVILLLNALVLGGAAYVEITYAPPVWVHIVLWVPLILGGTILMLRWFKAAFIALHYRNLVVEEGGDG
jgi:uncharacterized protein (DUF983 family)